MCLFLLRCVAAVCFVVSCCVRVLGVRFVFLLPVYILCICVGCALAALRCCISFLCSVIWCALVFEGFFFSFRVVDYYLCTCLCVYVLRCFAAFFCFVVNCCVRV